MAKTIQITTDFLGEETTLKFALQHYIKENEQIKKDWKKANGKQYMPNQHLVIAAIQNSKSILKKLE